MNIFVLDESPVVSAKYACDKHVVKMILESAQMLCAIHPEGTAPYKRSYYNHPCTKWARESFENYDWLIRHAYALCAEYSRRYNHKNGKPKVHKSQEVIEKNKIEYTEEDLLFNLKIISELNISDKLSYDDKLFSIDNPTYTQGLSRWWYGEDRAKTLEKLNNIIDATFKYMDNTFTNKVNLIGSKNIDEGILYENNSQVMQKFYATLLETIKGLEKLKNTYIHDKSMTTGLNLLIERIRRRTVKIDEISRIVPHSNLH